MRLRRPIAFILSAAVAASALTGCDSFSGHAAAAANSAQVQQLIEFIADLGLERDLRQALQKGGDLRQALLTLLGLESAVNFNVDDLTGARPGQHAVQVWEVTAQSAEDAAALAASQIRAVLEQLKSNGVTAGRIGMVEVDGKYYVVVDVEVTEENTFEPIRPASDDDDDNEDTPSAPAPTATMNNGKKIDLSSLGNNISAKSILDLAGENYTKDAITALDLSDCKNLTSIGKSGDYLGAFQGCESLKTVILPTSLESIGPHAFRGCNSLTSINLSGCTRLQNIGTSAFEGCDQLTTVTLPSSVTTIGNYAFSNTSLASIDLSGCTRLESTGVGAFTGSGLTSINLSGCISLKSIDQSAFQNCASLETVLLPESLREIGTQAFWNCTGLKTVKLPAKLTTIGGQAFEGCSSLETVLLPAKLTTISGWAFRNCSDLQSIYFQSVPGIANNAFEGVSASGLTVYYNSSTCDPDNLKNALKDKGFSGDFEAFIQGPPPLAYLLSL